MTKQSLQQQNWEVQICRFGKKITEQQICNLWLFTIEKKRKTLMIMTNVLWDIDGKPNYYEIQCECEKAYIYSNNNKTYQS